MRYRSRSRNYDSSDRYKSRRSPDRNDSSRGHKTKADHYNCPDESRKRDGSKHKKTSERYRYEYNRDSDSDDKIAKKGDSNFEKDYKSSKASKCDQDISTHEKRQRKVSDYTHSYRRNSLSSEFSDDSYKCKRADDRSDKKKPYYKDNKRIKLSRSISSEHKSNEKLKQDLKDKKDRKIKKKGKKSEKEKIDKKKKKRQKHSSEEEKNIESKKHLDVKLSLRKSIKTESTGDINQSKDKVKVEPFKVKENSILKTQINFLKSNNVFTKDEWQKEASDNDEKKKKEVLKVKSVLKQPLHDSQVESKQIKEEKNISKMKLCDENKGDLNKKKKLKISKLKINEKTSRDCREIKGDDDKTLSSKSKSGKRDETRSHSKNQSDKNKLNEQKERRSREHRNLTKSSTERKKADEYLSEDERLELPRTPTDAHFAGLFTRLPEESVSDTDIEDILPPILLDDKMNALLDNDPNGAQEAWDSEDDILLNKKENVVAPKHRGVLETLAVPWKLLIDEASLHNKDMLKSKITEQKDIPNILTNIGVSYKLAGETLWTNIAEKCHNVFFDHIPLIHQSIVTQKLRRSTIFRERGLFAGALSARKDFYIRGFIYETIT